MPSHKKSTADTTLRIIGGRWRGRLLRVPERPALRPTHDRVRETLFNWLMHDIVGANCLDAFAGSGALGFEALSRGAASITFIEQDRDLLQAINKNGEALGAQQEMQCLQTQSPAAGQRFANAPFDVVFLDPPFGSDLLPGCWSWLIDEELLSPKAKVYVEYAVGQELADIPGFSIDRSKQTKRVGYALYVRE